MIFPDPLLFSCSLERQHLPVHSSALAEAHEAARAAAFAKFDKERFGSSVEALRAALEAAVEREYRWALCWAVKGAGLVLCTLASHAPHTHPAVHSTACLLSPLPLHPASLQCAQGCQRQCLLHHLRACGDGL